MAEEILVKSALEKERIKAGKELLQRLTKTDLKVKAALWLWRAERPRWKLILASPFVNKKGQLEAYNKIDQTLYGDLGQIPDLEVSDIKPMATNKPLIKALRSHAKKYQSDLAGKRFEQYWLGDVAIDDAYIYFVK